MKENRIKKESRGRGAALLFLCASAAVSLSALIIYVNESDFSDKTLFILLTIIRYSSFLVCVCSIYLLITGIMNFILKPSVLTGIGIIIYLICLIYGAVIFIFDAFISVFAGGIR